MNRLDEIKASMATNMINEVISLRQKLDIAQKALEFYASNDINSIIFDYIDNGKIARKALQDIFRKDEN